MMKKVIVLLTALAVAAGFAGCQRESSFQSQEPQAASGEKVNTQLVLNVATSTAQTKQTGTAVQNDGSFRGLDYAYLLTYTQKKTDGKLNDGLILKDPATASQALELNRLFSTEATRRVIPVKLPVETNTLVFYGKSPDTSGEGASDAYGKLGAYSVAQSVGESYFDLGKRLTDNAGFGAMKKLLAGILTDVMNTSLGDTGFTVDGISVSPSDFANCKSWADYGSITDGKSKVEKDAEGNAMVWYVWEENLSYLYKQMTGIDYTTASADTELRAGSGAAILAMTKDIWQRIKSIISTAESNKATTKAEAVAKKLAEAIDGKLSEYFTYTQTTGDTPQTVVAFKGYDALLPLSTLTDDEKAALNTNPLKHTPAQFPSDFNLMPGVAYLTFINDINDVNYKKFVYPEVLNTMGMGGTEGFKVTDFYYPAELLYFGNSPVQAADVEYSLSDYPADADAWRNYLDDWATNWPNSHITATSRSVAMVNNIRYGVAMLETKVGFTSTVGEAEKIKTNNPNPGLSDQTMSVGAGTFKLTGVIVGGQSTRVGWNFLPVSGQGFIYDKFNAISVPISGTSVPNYTVVFDNYYAASETQNKVYVALEFQNNGHDFYGRKQKLVRNGDYFYLIGELDPASASEGIADTAWPTDNIIPPYTTNSSGDIISTKKPRIFIQDFKTTVTFLIGENSLKYAYLTVPDLRSTSMTLGLSVDIKWRQGLNYGSVVVGGTE